MDATWLARGLAIGFLIAAPVGPIGVLVIRRTLLVGRWTGFVSGAGAATADGFYGAVAGFGLSILSSFLLREAVLIRLVGGIFLVYLGAKILRAAPAERPAEAPAAGLAGAYLSTVLLTLTNPATILSFAAVFAGLGLGGEHGQAAAPALLVLGVFSGSLLWWFLLSSGVSLVRGRLSETSLRWVNILSGMCITGFGLLALAVVARSVLRLG